MRKKLEYGVHQYGPGGHIYNRAIVDEDVYLEWKIAFPEDAPIVIQDIDDRVELIYQRSRRDVINRLNDSDLGRKWLTLNYPEDGK